MNQRNSVRMSFFYAYYGKVIGYVTLQPKNIIFMANELFIDGSWTTVIPQ